MELLAALYIGQTSDLYKKLVVTEQKVDYLDVDVPASFDPSLFTVIARVKKPADAVYVRDQILGTIAQARSVALSPERLSDAKSYNRFWRAFLPRCSRLITVPIGISRMSAISL